MSAVGPDSYSVGDAARLLHVSVEALRKRLAKGALIGDRQGKQWRIDREQVEWERAALLESLQAIDSRPGRQSSLREGGVAESQLEVERLKMVIQDLIVAERAHLDALHQFVVPRTAND